MAEKDYFEIVPATASATSKDEAANQDRAWVFYPTVANGAAGVVVCDGVGSYTKSGETAERAVSAVRDHMTNSEEVTGDLGGCIHAAAEALNGDPEGAATPLVVTANPTGAVSYALVGNGAVLEVRALETVPGQFAINYNELTFAHMSYEQGRPALQSFLPGAGSTPERGTRQLARGSARLFLSCTDGLVTEDAPRVMPDSLGNLWKEIHKPLASLLGPIGQSWAALLEVAQPERMLSTLLQETLVRMAQEGELDDDATVGALLMRPTNRDGRGDRGSL